MGEKEVIVDLGSKQEVARLRRIVEEKLRSASKESPSSVVGIAKMLGIPVVEKTQAVSLSQNQVLAALITLNLVLQGVELVPFSKKTVDATGYKNAGDFGKWLVKCGYVSVESIAEGSITLSIDRRGFKKIQVAISTDNAAPWVEIKHSSVAGSVFPVRYSPENQPDRPGGLLCAAKLFLRSLIDKS